MSASWRLWPSGTNTRIESRSERVKTSRSTNQPMCLLCGKKARYLNDQYGHGALIFCSLKCATKWAMNKCVLMRWCRHHRSWYHTDSGCDKCINERLTPDPE